MKKDTVLVVDFGSQYTQLIARRIRELKVYSLVKPYTISASELKQIKPKAIILSGGPYSVYQKGAPKLGKHLIDSGIPVLGICYGMQSLIQAKSGLVKESRIREYGQATMYIDNHNDLFFSLPAKISSWMSHTDQLVKLPPGFKKLAHTIDTKFAAVGNLKEKVYGVQFHPEVVHTEYGIQIISNFLFRIAECFANWQLEDFLSEEIERIKNKVGNGNVICGLSGGVDSSTGAVLLQRALGRKLKCIFVNNGLLRKNEAQRVLKVFRDNYKINLSYVDASKSFLDKLKQITDPEQKRKIIGHEFINVFEQEAKKFKKAQYLMQGTLYPDVIESVSFFGGPTACIKSHHNVGGLPAKMKLKLIEPFKDLFKDEVRKIAEILGLPRSIVSRHPFPGPGLAVRILGEVNRQRLKILKEADYILEKVVKEEKIYDDFWQIFSVLLPVKSVGVMGDKRTYENALVVRAVTSLDGMTADWAKISPEILAKISNQIINKVRGINRVVYDISSKPPATIEWE